MKVYEYLNKLPLTQAQKETITESGYENGPTLYIMCRRIPTAMKQVLELDSLDALEKAIWETLTADERTAIEEELAQQ